MNEASHDDGQAGRGNMPPGKEGDETETCANHAVGSSPQSIHPSNERDLTAQEEEVEPITTEGV